MIELFFYGVYICVWVWNDFFAWFCLYGFVLFGFIVISLSLMIGVLGLELQMGLGTGVGVNWLDFIWVACLIGVGTCLWLVCFIVVLCRFGCY